MLAGSRGLAFSAPIVLLGVAGALWLARRRGDPARPDAVVALAVGAGLFLVQAGSSQPPYAGGESVGVRYLIPAFPFFAVPLAAVWRRVPGTARFLAFFGAAVMLLPTLTQHLVPRGAFGLQVYLDRLVDGQTTPTLFTMALGPWGWLVHLAAVTAAGLALARASSRPPPGPVRPTRSADLAQLPLELVDLVAQTGGLLEAQLRGASCISSWRLWMSRPSSSGGSPSVDQGRAPARPCAPAPPRAATSSPPSRPGAPSRGCR